MSHDFFTILLGAGLLIYGIYKFICLINLKENGFRSRAKVLDKNIINNDDGESYFVKYSIVEGGIEMHESTLEVKREYYAMVRIGDNIDIAYNKSNPKSSVIIEDMSYQLNNSYIMIAAGVGAMIFGLFGIN